jgi:hypothetical protein
MVMYIYIWKCHKGTPCIAILNKQKMSFIYFTKLENRKAEQILSGGWYQWEGGSTWGERKG